MEGIFEGDKEGVYVRVDEAEGGVTIDMLLIDDVGIYSLWGFVKQLKVDLVV